MIANGHVVGDGSWDLRVFVTDLQTERQIRVKGDVHIGGVMLRLVEDLGESIGNQFSLPPLADSGCNCLSSPICLRGPHANLIIRREIGVEMIITSKKEL